MFMETKTPEQIEFAKGCLTRFFEKHQLPLPQNALELFDNFINVVKAEYVYIGANEFTHLDGTVANTVILGSGKDDVVDGRVSSCDLNFYAVRFYEPKQIADTEFRKLNVLNLVNRDDRYADGVSRVAQLNHGMSISLQAAFYYLNNHNVLYVD